MRPAGNSSELTAEQVEVLLARVLPLLAYRRKLLTRIEQLHFPPDDPLRRDVQTAYDAMHGLRVALHYMACDRQKRARSPTGNYERYRRKRASSDDT